jgi:hypothetical protein
VERLRRILTTELIHLQSLQSALHQTAPTTARNDFEDPHEESFNDDDTEADPLGEDQIIEGRDSELDLPPERMPLNLPSSHNTNTTAHPFHQAEYVLRVKQATRYLAALRDAIAQKSFQYSHVMRSAPTKGARPDHAQPSSASLTRFHIIPKYTAEPGQPWSDSALMKPL